MNVLVSSPAMILLGSSHSSLLTFARHSHRKILTQWEVELESEEAGQSCITYLWASKPPKQPCSASRWWPSSDQGSLVRALSTHYRRWHQDSKTEWELKPAEGKRSEATAKSRSRAAIELVKPILRPYGQMFCHMLPPSCVYPKRLLSLSLSHKVQSIDFRDVCTKLMLEKVKREIWSPKCNRNNQWKNVI